MKKITPFIVPAIYLIGMTCVIAVLHISPYLQVSALVTLIAFGILALPGFCDHLRVRARMLVMLVGLCGIAAVLCYNLNNLWVDHHGFNGAVWSIFARVIERWGFFKTQGLCFWTGGSQFVSSAAVYDHHPPGLTWLLALAFQACGVHEAVARAIPVFFSLLGVVSLVIWLTRKLGWSSAAAVFPVLLASPGLAYFGRMVNFEPVILGLSLTFYAWLLLRPAARGATFGLLLIVLAAPLFGWCGSLFAMGAGFALARCRFGWRVLPSLGLVLLPLMVFGFCLLYGTNWGGHLSEILYRAMAWNNFFHKGLADYGFFEWLRHVAGHAALLMPWPLWILLALLPWSRLGRDGAMILCGTMLPFLLLIPLMPHAMYQHDYHMLFWWPAATISCAHLAARFKKSALMLVVGLLLLHPVATGLRTTQAMHGSGGYALHQARSGMSLRALVPPAAKVAVINTAGDPVPILAYYLDRHYQTFSQPGTVAGDWDYYIFLHDFRGISDEEQNLLMQFFVPVPDAYVPTFMPKSGA